MEFVSLHRYEVVAGELKSDDESKWFDPFYSFLSSVVSLVSMLTLSCLHYVCFNKLEIKQYSLANIYNTYKKEHTLEKVRHYSFVTVFLIYLTKLAPVSQLAVFNLASGKALYRCQYGAHIVLWNISPFNKSLRCLLRCQRLFVSCNNGIYHLRVFNVWGRKKTWMPPQKRDLKFIKSYFNPTFKCLMVLFYHIANYRLTSK